MSMFFLPTLTRAADVNVLILGASQLADYYPNSTYPMTSKAFVPANVQSELQKILAGATGVTNINVTLGNLRLGYYDDWLNLLIWYHYVDRANYNNTDKVTRHWLLLRGELA